MSLYVISSQIVVPGDLVTKSYPAIQKINAKVHLQKGKIQNVSETKKFLKKLAKH